MNMRDQVPEVPSGHLDLTRIGASDMPALLGVDKYRSAHDIYLRLTEGVVEDSFPARLQEAADWGHRMEPLTAVALCEKLGWDVESLERGGTRVLDVWEWARVSPDFLLLGDAGALIECKLISSRRFDSEDWGEDGSAQVPARIQAQVLFQMMAVKAEPKYWAQFGLNVDALDGVYVAVCVGGQRLRHYFVPYDAQLCRYIHSLAEAFWYDHVQDRLPPTPDGSEACAKALALMAKPDAPQRAATEEEAGLMERILEQKDIQAEAKKAQTALENELKGLLSDEAGGVAQGPLRASWVERKGATSWSSAAKALASQTGSEALLEELKAAHVGAASRYLKVQRRKA